MSKTNRFLIFLIVVTNLLIPNQSYCQDSPTPKMLAIFANHRLEKNALELTFRSSGSRYLVRSVGGKSHLSNYDEMIILPASGKSELVDKHFRLEIIPLKRGDKTTWFFRQTSDLRSVGGKVTQSVSGIVVDSNGSRPLSDAAAAQAILKME